MATPVTSSGSIQGTLPLISDLTENCLSYLLPQEQSYFAEFNNGEYRDLINKHRYQVIRRTADELMSNYIVLKGVFASPSISPQLNSCTDRLKNMEKLHAAIVPLPANPINYVEEAEKLKTKLNTFVFDFFEIVGELDLGTLARLQNRNNIDTFPDSKLKNLATWLKNYFAVNSNSERGPLLMTMGRDHSWLRLDNIFLNEREQHVLCKILINELEKEVKAFQDILPQEKNSIEYRCQKKIAYYTFQPYIEAAINLIDTYFKDAVLISSYPQSEKRLTIVKFLVFFDRFDEAETIAKSIQHDLEREKALIEIIDNLVKKPDIARAQSLLNELPPLINGRERIWILFNGLIRNQHFAAALEYIKEIPDANKAEAHLIIGNYLVEHNRLEEAVEHVNQIALGLCSTSARKTLREQLFRGFITIKDYARATDIGTQSLWDSVITSNNVQQIWDDIKDRVITDNKFDLIFGSIANFYYSQNDFSQAFEALLKMEAPGRIFYEIKDKLADLLYLKIAIADQYDKAISFTKRIAKYPLNRDVVSKITLTQLARRDHSNPKQSLTDAQELINSLPTQNASRFEAPMQEFRQVYRSILETPPPEPTQQPPQQVPEVIKPPVVKKNELMLFKRLTFNISNYVKNLFQMLAKFFARWRR